MRTNLDYSQYVETASKALDAGASFPTGTSLTWDLAGRCESPVFRTLTARPDRERLPIWSDKARFSTARRDIDLWTRCRKCAECLRMRSARWKFRAKAEIDRSVRTWFGTLTLSPEQHFKMMLRASHRLEARGVQFDQLSQEAQFLERHKEISLELTKWVKRVREESGAPFRYLLVVEPHTGKRGAGKGSGENRGMPHYHILIHESDADRPVRADTLRKQWSFGFTRWDLVAQGDESKHASYAAKYLSKCASSRVRASLGYGLSCADATPSRHTSRQGGEISNPLGAENKSARKAVFNALNPPRHSPYWRDKFLSEHECSEPSGFKPWSPMTREELRKSATRTVQ